MTTKAPGSRVSKATTTHVPRARDLQRTPEPAATQNGTESTSVTPQMSNLLLQLVIFKPAKEQG